MKKKLIKSLALSSLVLGVSVALASQVDADIQTDTIDEVWGKPTLVYGAGLSDDQVNQTNKAFNISDINNVNRQVNSGADFETYLQQTGVSDSSLFSSVLVQKRSKGKGVTVKIETPNNITSITANQYANAAITAGASDVEIEVASPVKVTGESALVGVYKALSANGEEVDNARAEVASQELSTNNAISSAHSDDKNFDSDALNTALAQIKTDLANYKQDNGSTADTSAVTDIVKKALKDNGLEGILSEDEISQLVSFAKTYQSTDAIDSKEVADQLATYKDKVSKTLSDAYKNVQDSGVLEKIGNFFENLWKSLFTFF